MSARRLPFPLLADLRALGWSGVLGDLVAGLTTAVILVPQAMAYALLAGLPPVVGLYAAVLPPLAYALLGTSRELSVGPVAMDSLLVLSALSGLGPLEPARYAEAAAGLALLVAGFQLVLGALRLGYLVTFLSQPVQSGFTSAAAILIAMSQMPLLLGVEAIQGTDLIEMTSRLAPELPKADRLTVLVGAGSIALLILQKRSMRRAPGALVVLALAGFLALLPGFHGHVKTIGLVPKGLPAFELPRITDFLPRLLPSAFVIALVGFMESIAVGRVYAKKGRYPISADRELLALGVSNTVAGLFQGYPVAGGFARTAVNAEAGARSGLATVFSSVIVALVLVFFTPLFAYIPKAALAAIIVAAVFGLVDIHQVKARFRVQPSDGVLLVISFLATVTLGIMTGLILGILASIAWSVLRTTRPHIAVLGRVPGTLLFKNVQRYPNLVTYDDVLMIRLDAQLYFANAEYLRDQLLRLESMAKLPPRAIILDASSINHIDSSAVELLEELSGDYQARGVDFYLTGIKGPVSDTLKRTHLWQKTGRP